MHGVFSFSCSHGLAADTETEESDPSMARDLLLRDAREFWMVRENPTYVLYALLRQFATGEYWAQWASRKDYRAAGAKGGTRGVW